MTKVGELRPVASPCEVCGSPATQILNGVTPVCSDPKCYGRVGGTLSKKIAEAQEGLTHSQVERSGFPR